MSASTAATSILLQPLEEDEELPKLVQTRIGTFCNFSGSMLVCDPAYISEPRCRVEIDGCSRGSWETYIVHNEREDGSGHICCLLATHESFRVSRKVILSLAATCLPVPGFEMISNDVWVDTGLCGIFDYGLAAEVMSSPADLEAVCSCIDDFVASCSMSASSRKLPAGLAHSGAVCASGDGPGMYRCYADWDRNGAVDAVLLQFLQP